MQNLLISITGNGLNFTNLLICCAISLFAGFVLSLSHNYKNQTTKSFSVTIALLPLIVQIIIMLVNGNLGTGIAVAGAFSLVRFRSVPGSAKEILTIFMAMAVGLATGVGHIAVAVIFTLILILMNFIYSFSNFGNNNRYLRELKITIPENLNFTECFNSEFEEFTNSVTLKRVKTTNMGSLYQLIYSVNLKKNINERDFINKLRVKNGNLEICLNYHPTVTEEL